MGITVRAEHVGKKFYNRWVFRGVSFELTPGDSLAIVGDNGSGKSTLLKILLGMYAPNEGKVFLEIDGKTLPKEKIYTYVSWSGPYLDLFPDLNLVEQLHLHFSFKKCLLDTAEDLVQVLNLDRHKDKKLRYYSSGMLQRVKVGLGLFSQSEILLLDEPTSNMDEENAAYILDLIEKWKGDRTYVIASNLNREFASISNVIDLRKVKNQETNP